MAILKIETKSTIQNPSLQVGDYAYYQKIDDTNTINTANNPLFIGKILSISPGFIEVDSSLTPSNITGFLMFLKDKRINTSGLNGYYAEVTFKNNDNKNFSELYAVNSQFTASSK
jgi:hypothetical protein